MSLQFPLPSLKKMAGVPGVLPFLFSGSNTGHLTAALTAGLQDTNIRLRRQLFRIKAHVYVCTNLNLLVGLGEELGVTPLSCDGNHWTEAKQETQTRTPDPDLM